LLGPVSLITTIIAVIAAALSGGAGGSNAGQAEVAQARIEPVGQRLDYRQGALEFEVNVTGIDHHGCVKAGTTCATSEGLAAYEILVGFNPNIVDVESIDAGAWLRQSGRRVNCFERSPRAGEYAAACVSSGEQPGMQGSGQLGTIHLEPKANGRSYLSIRVNLSGPLGDPIDVDEQGGVVGVYNAPTTAPDPEPGDPPSANDNDNNSNNTNGNTTTNSQDTDGDGILDTSDSDLDGDTIPNESDEDVDGDGIPNREDPDYVAPVAGTGYDPPGPEWPVPLAGALAAAGLGLVMAAGGARLTSRR
jgi:hypothetical protein